MSSLTESSSPTDDERILAPAYPRLGRVDEPHRARKPTLGQPASEWGIDGGGSSNIEGLATDISVNHGNQSTLKINTDSTHYPIDVYRLGTIGETRRARAASLSPSKKSAVPLSTVNTSAKLSRLRSRHWCGPRSRSAMYSSAARQFLSSSSSNQTIAEYFGPLGERTRINVSQVVL